MGLPEGTSRDVWTSHPYSRFLSGMIPPSLPSGLVPVAQRFLQAPWLYVYDPKALQSVCMKDHESYQKGSVTDT